MINKKKPVRLISSRLFVAIKIYFTYFLQLTN